MMRVRYQDDTRIRLMDNTQMLYISRLIIAICLLTTLSANAETAPRLPLLSAEKVSLSGLSSGAFMAAQLHVIYSSQFVGAGLVAGGPYHCAGMNSMIADVITAQTRCMNPCGLWFWPFSLVCERMFLPDGESLWEHALENAEQGLIDDPANLQKQRIYLFSGGEDQTVTSGVVDSVEDFYKASGGTAEKIHHVQIANAAHAYITEEAGQDCDKDGAPFINDCDYNQAKDILETIYGPLQDEQQSNGEQLWEFDQTEFLDQQEFRRSGLADTGFVLIPDSCQQQSCKLHIAFHGCRQSAAESERNSLLFHQAAGYNPIAINNNIIMLYPQIRAMDTMDDLASTPYNPKGCWDFWGYSGDDYFNKNSLQGKAVMAMVKRLSSQSGQ
ncbi:MAG: hypothetical protein V7739_10245 [Motiliproteus sp.]